MSKFTDMTVKELKDETRKVGLTLEYKGHKFNKAELVERLEQYYKVVGETEQTFVELDSEAEENEVWVQSENLPKHKEEQPEPNMEDDYEAWKKVPDKISEKKHFFDIKFAETLDEIEEKYRKPKPQFVFDNNLNVGSFVVFVCYVEANNGNIYKKLRTAKVVAVNRKKELVRVQTFLGDEKELPFEELLFIKKDKELDYPTDIKKYLRKQRTENGRKLLNERFN